MNRGKSWGLPFVFVIVVLFLGIVPSRARAQIVIGYYHLVSLTADSMRGTVAGPNGCGIGDGITSKSIGVVIVEERDPSASVYLEHWAMLDTGPMLVPEAILELRPVPDTAPAHAHEIARLDPRVVWNARSEEETRHASVSIADLAETAAARAERRVEIAEIIQCQHCDDELGTGEMMPVGWVLEWTDATGAPFRHEWWLTAEYQYPFPAMRERTLLRTLDDRERAIQTQHSIVKRIVVELNPVSVSDGIDNLLETEDTGPQIHGIGDAGNCTAGRSLGGGSVEFAGSLIAVIAVWRRRRSRRS